jgi:tRNA pseudouridine38-40 synthase
VTGLKGNTEAESSRIILVIEYDGRGYCGSQVQPGAPTIQGEVEKALQQLTAKNVRIASASRTDAGVHAKGQVFSFVTDSVYPVQTFVEGLNHYLPEDIAVKAAYRTDVSFDVRRRAVNREYRYYIHNSRTRSPLHRGSAWRVYGELDIEAMREACRCLIGRHDFASFVSSENTAREKTTVREIMKAEITEDGNKIVLVMVARSFLPHQVRSTVGALVQVGRGKMTVDEFRGLLEAGTPGLAGPMAPAEGLYLEKVNYSIPFEGEAR